MKIRLQPRLQLRQPARQKAAAPLAKPSIVVAHPPAEPASPAASPEPKRSRPDGLLDEYDFDASQPGFFDKLTPDRILGYVFFGTHASLIELCKQLSHQGRLVNAFLQRRDFDRAVLNARRPPQLQRQTLDLREEAELAKRSLNVIVKNLKMEEGENSEKLARAFEREILDRMGLTGEIELAAHRLPRARGKAGPPPLLLTFKTPADKISFLRRRKRREKTLFTLDDDLTLAQQQRRRELWPTYTSSSGRPRRGNRCTGRGRPSTSATSPGRRPPRPQRLQAPQLRGIQQ
eukprot:jgi/Mesvir1/21688/Mv04108-RA.1